MSPLSKLLRGESPLGELAHLECAVGPRTVAGDHFFVGHSGRPCTQCGEPEEHRWHLFNVGMVRRLCEARKMRSLVVVLGLGLITLLATSASGCSDSRVYGVIHGPVTIIYNNGQTADCDSIEQFDRGMSMWYRCVQKDGYFENKLGDVSTLKMRRTRTSDERPR